MEIVSANLKVDRLAETRECRLLERLGERGVSVAGARNVLGAGRVFHRERALGNHLTRVGAHDVDAEHAVGLLLHNEFDLAFRLHVGLGTRVRKEGELADLVFHAVLLDLLLSAANPRNLGVGVDNRRDHVVVDVAMARLDNFRGSNALILGLVRKHRAKGRVTNALDALAGGVVLVIHNNTAAVVRLDTDSLEVEATGHRATANRKEHAVGLNLFGLAALDLLKVEHNLVRLTVNRRQLRAEAELDALLLERALERLGNLAIDARATDRVLELDHGDVRAETAPHRAHLETNHTATHDNEALGHLGQRERAGRRHHAVLVDLETRERGHLRASGDNDVLGLELSGAALEQVHAHGRGRGEAAGALDIVDLVLLEQALDTLRQGRDRVLLGLEHDRQVELDVANVNATALGVVQRRVVDMRVVEQRLGRNATHIQAGATESATVLNTRSTQAELRSLDRRDIAARTATDDDHVIRVGAGGKATRTTADNAGERERANGLVSENAHCAQEQDAKGVPPAS